MKALIYALIILFSHTATAQEPTMKIKITLGHQIHTATLEDNPTTQALLKQLPLSLPAENYGGIEKIAYLSQKLPDSPNHNGNFAPKAGDVTYYAPWGNLALFHGNTKPANGLIYLGRFDGEFKPSATAKQIRIERVE
ncbi:cyclophilin-like fold protein [Testudinibacter sp. TR-2022]|uniref:cyclophilin-like fold protein n=1 Tax=Testudinibacter sp. TR-2022 TaxID=2585029 RepID=UPI002278DD6D|nr:cyclophilin-like fold protein [Testudinibacter sp. TR-2022]